MELNSPLIISGRLLPAVRLKECVISIQTSKALTVEGEIVYHSPVVFFDFHDGKSYMETNFSGPAQPIEDWFETLLNFLQAWLESSEHSENSDLFPSWIRDYFDADEVDMLSWELHYDED